MKKKNLNVRLYLMYLLAMAPLILFGIYKNGLALYQKGLGDIWTLARPLTLLTVALLGTLIGGLLRERRRTKKLDKTILDKLKGDVVEAILLVAILPIGSNHLAILGTTFIFSLLLSKLSLNRIALMYLVVEGINVLLGNNEFNNAYEVCTILNLDGFDLFFGNGVGGIFSTNILLVASALIFLSFNKLYKKEMVYASLITFLLAGSIPFMLTGQYFEIFDFIFGYNILFILVFIAPNLYSSSYTVKGQVTSGILTGLLTCLFARWIPYTSAILAVLLTSVLKGILDRIYVVK